MTLYLGIDLGTTNSAICGISDGKVRIFKTPEGTDIMPSVLHRDKRGNQTVGVRAFDRAIIAPENAVNGFKRQMGTATPFRFSSTGEAITPENAASEVLRTLVGYALMESGTSSVAGAVVTIPAAFNQVQCEATLAAARASGLERVALLQEPVAAALAAMAVASLRSGIFLIYDFGGGTFDAALVHAQEGQVTVLGHEGINMLGGGDIDLAIVDAAVVPWLRRTFELPDKWTVDAKYRRLLRVLRRSAETAKISLSTGDSVRVSASDEDVRLEDLRGEPIYLDVPLPRATLEPLASPFIDRSIDCCRDLLAQVGFRHEDVARVVLIGGPTKMPLLRRMVLDGLGIQIEDPLRVDPMTAVAAGAAIYCEGRNWSDTGSTAKATRRTERGGTAVAVSFSFEARTASDHAALLIRQESGAPGAEVLVESNRGWSSDRRKLDHPITLELPLRELGPNRFRATVFSANGTTVPDAGREIVVERLLASTAGVPLPYTIAAKIIGDDGQNTLSVVVQKGTILPTTGRVRFRSAETLQAGRPGKIKLELFQIADERIRDPTLHRFIGEHPISADVLPEGATLRKGDEVIVHWGLSEGQEFTAEIELPAVRQRFGPWKCYDWQVARQNFDGEDGAKLADSHLQVAERDLANAEEAVPPAHAAALPRLRQRLDAHMENVRATVDPDARQRAVEEAMQLRQQIALVCLQPDARRHLLRQRLNRQRNFYQRDIRAGATRDQAAHVDLLSGSADDLIKSGSPTDLEVASDQIKEINRLYWHHGLDQDAFCAAQFNVERGKRHLARNRSAFDRTIASGDKALAAGDAAALRRALFDIWRDQAPLGNDISAAERASLMRG